MKKKRLKKWNQIYLFQVNLTLLSSLLFMINLFSYMERSWKKDRFRSIKMVCILGSEVVKVKSLKEEEFFIWQITNKKDTEKMEYLMANQDT